MTYSFVDYSFVVKSKFKGLIRPVLFLFLKIAFIIWSHLCFHRNCENFCYTSVKNALDNLIVIATESVDCFGLRKWRVLTLKMYIYKEQLKDFQTLGVTYSYFLVYLYP